MSKQRTGRKVGRPKTYQSADDKPRTLSVRLPRALYARLEREALAQQCTITALVEAALEACLQEDGA